MPYLASYYNKKVFIMPYIKNIPHEEVVSFAESVQTVPGQVVSRTLAQNDAVSLTVFAFSEGEEIGTHDSTGDALVTVIDGVGRFVVDGKSYTLKQGQSLIMPAKKPHSVHAEEDFKMVLTVVFPQ